MLILVHIGYCDTRYKIAGQWYVTLPPEIHSKTLTVPGTASQWYLSPVFFLSTRSVPTIICTRPPPDIPHQLFSSSKTLGTEIVSSTDKEVTFKLRQEYTPKLLNTPKAVNSLVSLALVKDEADGGKEKVVYHKDMWNEKDYSHWGIGKVLKTMNGDYLTAITQPEKDL